MLNKKGIEFNLSTIAILILILVGVVLIAWYSISKFNVLTGIGGLGKAEESAKAGLLGVDFDALTDKEKKDWKKKDTLGYANHILKEADNALEKERDYDKAIRLTDGFLNDRSFTELKEYPALKEIAENIKKSAEKRKLDFTAGKKIDDYKTLLNQADSKQDSKQKQLMIDELRKLGINNPSLQSTVEAIISTYSKDMSVEQRRSSLVERKAIDPPAKLQLARDYELLAERDSNKKKAEDYKSALRIYNDIISTYKEDPQEYFDLKAYLGRGKLYENLNKRFNPTLDSQGKIMLDLGDNFQIKNPMYKALADYEKALEKYASSKDSNIQFILKEDIKPAITRLARLGILDFIEIEWKFRGELVFGAYKGWPFGHWESDPRSFKVSGTDSFVGKVTDGVRMRVYNKRYGSDIFKIVVSRANTGIAQFVYNEQGVKLHEQFIEKVSFKSNPLEAPVLEIELKDIVGQSLCEDSYDFKKLAKPFEDYRYDRGDFRRNMNLLDEKRSFVDAVREWNLNIDLGINLDECGRYVAFQFKGLMFNTETNKDDEHANISVGFK